MGLGTWAWGNRFLWGYDESMDPELQVRGGGGGQQSVREWGMSAGGRGTFWGPEQAGAVPCVTRKVGSRGCVGAWQGPGTGADRPHVSDGEGAWVPSTRWAGRAHFNASSRKRGESGRGSGIHTNMQGRRGRWGEAGT